VWKKKVIYSATAQGPEFIQVSKHSLVYIKLNAALECAGKAAKAHAVG